MKESNFIFHKGKAYARVSTVISKEGQFDHIPPLVLANKARIGSEVHEAIEADIEDSFPVLTADCIGYYNSYVAWKDETNPQFIISEERFFCDKLMITGKIDVIAKIGQENVLLDFKTSVQESPSWILQGHLYHYLLTQAEYNISKKMIFVKLDKKGKEAKVFEYIYNITTFDLCINLIEEFWKKEEINK